MDFWNDFDILEKETDPDDYVDWWFLVSENGAEAELKEPLKEANMTLYDFLHGECTIFAQYLKNTYGYTCEAVFEYGRLVHMYCMDDDGNYLDIRGKCDDWDKFMQDFYDLGMYDNADSVRFKTYKRVPGKYSDRTKDKRFLKLCKKIDKAYGYWK